MSGNDSRQAVYIRVPLSPSSIGTGQIVVSLCGWRGNHGPDRKKRQRNCDIGLRRWIDDISEWTGMEINDATRVADDNEFNGDVFYVPPTLHMEDGTKQRRVQCVERPCHTHTLHCVEIYFA